MATVDEGNALHDTVQKVATETIDVVSDATATGDDIGVPTVSVALVQDEISPNEVEACASTDVGDAAAERPIDLTEEDDISVDDRAPEHEAEMVQEGDKGLRPQDDGTVGEVATATRSVDVDAADATTQGDADREDQHMQHDADEKENADDVEYQHNDEDTDDEDVRYHDGDDGDDDDDDDQGDGDHGDVRHNDDEYDPANPSHDMDTDAYDSSERPKSADHALDEYDPANPAEGFEKKDKTESSPVLKRKLSDTPTVGSAASPAASNTSTRSPKRPRNSSSHKGDQRGLKDSAWDRLVDLESMGEFRIAQVSRAAFSTIAALAEFAQCAIVARFTRTPMKDIRDKNELILRLCREYLSENPQVSLLQPVSAYVDDAAADKGLFTFGYAPPKPTSGMSTVKVPFRHDKPGSISTPSAPSAFPQKLTKPSATASATNKPQLDEFGREIKSVSTPSNTEHATPSSAPVSAPAQSVAPAAPATMAGGKPSDPRRRRQGGADAAPAESMPPTTDTRGQVEKSDVYNRLPLSVRSRLDGLIAARRLPEAINDNVLSRLNHLPEATAVSAIEKFMESDLGQISNINGFLVGIINRVQERGNTPSDPRSVANTTRGGLPNAPVTSSYQQQQQHTPHQPHQHSSQNAPGPLRGYAPHGAAAPPMDHPHSFDLAAGNQFRDHQMQPPVAAAPVGYDARSTAQPPPAYTPDAPAAWNQAHATAPGPYSAQPGVHAAGRFSSHVTIDKAIAVLPVSIQNHLVSLVNSRILPSLDDLSEKCYETLGQLSEGLANDVLKRFGTANLISVRNRSAFLMGVVKKCRQEYGFD